MLTRRKLMRDLITLGMGAALPVSLVVPPLVINKIPPISGLTARDIILEAMRLLLVPRGHSKPEAMADLVLALNATLPGKVNEIKGVGYP